MVYNQVGRYTKGKQEGYSEIYKAISGEWELKKVQNILFKWNCIIES